MATRSKKAEQSSTGALRILFPQRSILTPDDGHITMSPIPLKKLPSVMEHFMIAASLASQGIPPAQMLVIAAESILTLLDICILEENKKTEYLTGTSAPYLVEVFLDQNLSGEILGKWTALIDRIKEIFPAGASLLTQSESSQSPLNT